MPLPAQLEVIAAAEQIVSDRVITPQEMEWFMQFFFFAMVMMALGTIQWEELTESYEEAMTELTTGEE
jgi:hypothetical protein